MAFAVVSFAVYAGSVITISLRQRLSPPDLMGRVGSAWRGVVWGAFPIGSLIGGALAVHGLRLPLIIAGVAQCVVALAIARPMTRQPRRLGASLGLGWWCFGRNSLGRSNLGRQWVRRDGLRRRYPGRWWTARDHVCAMVARPSRRALRAGRHRRPRNAAFTAVLVACPSTGAPGRGHGADSCSRNAGACGPVSIGTPRAGRSRSTARESTRRARTP